MQCLDLQGKVCPFVLFYTKKKLETLLSGEELEVIINDPTAKENISGWCTTHQHEILEICDHEGCIKIMIKKS